MWPAQYMRKVCRGNQTTVTMKTVSILTVKLT